MKLQIKVDEDGKITDACFKTFGCSSAIASFSVALFEALQVLMESKSHHVLRPCILILFTSTVAMSFHQSNARGLMQFSQSSSRHLFRKIVPKPRNALGVLNLLASTVNPSLDSLPNTQPYGVSSPFSLAPFDSLGPSPLPGNSPPYCTNNPPSIPQSPATATNSPTSSTVSPFLPIQSPPGSPLGQAPSPPGTPLGQASSPPDYTSTPPVVSGPPSMVPTPFGNIPTSPPTTFPSPTGSGFSPPVTGFSPPYNEPSPPYYEPSPPSYIPSPPNFPSPTVFVPGSPIFQPPIVFPPPTVPPPPNTGPTFTLWCVAKPSVPEPIIQEAMNYACGSGADCNSIQPDGTCFEPNTLLLHASYAFNSYWQRTKVAGGTCEFGGTAMLVSVDPSYDGCRFINY